MHPVILKTWHKNYVTSLTTQTSSFRSRWSTNWLFLINQTWYLTLRNSLTDNKFISFCGWLFSGQSNPNVRWHFRTQILETIFPRTVLAWDCFVWFFVIQKSILKKVSTLWNNWLCDCYQWLKEGIWWFQVLVLDLVYKVRSQQL